MLVSCPSCSAKFNVPDAKVAGKRARMKCKKCGDAIPIDGTHLSAEAPDVVAPREKRTSTRPKKSRTRSAPRRPPTSSGISTRWRVSEPSGKEHEMSLADVARSYSEGGFEPGTLVCAPGRDDWLPPYDHPAVMDMASPDEAPPARPPQPTFSENTVTLGAEESAKLTQAAARENAAARGAARSNSFFADDDVDIAMDAFDNIVSVAPGPANARSARPAVQLKNLPSGGSPSTPPPPPHRKPSVPPPRSSSIPVPSRSASTPIRPSTSPPSPAPPRASSRPAPPFSSRPPVPTSRPAPVPPSPSYRASAPPQRSVPPSLPPAPSQAPGAPSVPPPTPSFAPRPQSYSSSAPLPSSSVPAAPSFPAAPPVPSASIPGSPLPSAPAPSPSGPYSANTPHSLRPSEPTFGNLTAPPSRPQKSSGLLPLFVAFVLVLGAIAGIYVFRPALFQRGVHRIQNVLGIEGAGSIPEKAKGPPFDAQAAGEVLGQVAAQASKCRKPDGPVGKGRAQVLYAPNGSASSVAVSRPFHETEVGTCLQEIFKKTTVPAFGGDPVVVSKTFDVK